MLDCFIPQEPLFLGALFRPPKKHTNSIFLVNLVSFRVPVRGGNNSLVHSFSVPALTLGPPGPKMGPGQPPRSPNDTQNMIFYPLFIDSRAIFGRLGVIVGLLSGCSEQKTATEALTDLFTEIKSNQTPAVIERIVNDIDDIVKVVRFDGWKNSKSGEREVKKSLRKTLLKYKLHKDNKLFIRAYDYIKQYY